MTTAPRASTWAAGADLTDALIDTNQTDYLQIALDTAEAAAYGGWSVLTSLIASGYDTNGGGAGFQYHPAYKVNDAGEVKMRGGIKKNSGSFPSGNTTLIASLPGAIVPTNDIELSCAMENSGGVVGRLEITSSGALNIILDTSRGSWISLDGITYDIS